MPSPDGSGILFWRRSPKKIEWTAGMASQKTEEKVRRLLRYARNDSHNLYIC